MNPAPPTPDGLPVRCAVCGADIQLDTHSAGGDAPCPNCGLLLVRSAQQAESIRERLAAALEIELSDLSGEATLHSLITDSLELFEALMDIEEEFGIRIPQDETEATHTINDLVRLIIERAASEP